MGRLLARENSAENSATIDKEINTRRTFDVKGVGPLSLNEGDALRKAVRKLRWIGMQAEAQMIERLLTRGARDERTLHWPWETD